MVRTFIIKIHFEEHVHKLSFLILAAANGEGDQDDDDDSDGDDNNNKDTRRRKIKTKDGKIVFVNEEQTSQAAKRAKLEIDDARVKVTLL